MQTIVPALCATGVAQINAIQGSWCIRVRWLRVVIYLDIGSKSICAMFLKVQSLSMQYHMWTVVVGNTIFGWEKIFNFLADSVTRTFTIVFVNVVYGKR